jgi:DNA-binding beta-propeller fold protein YncE
MRLGATIALGCAALSGCASPAGPVFPPLTEARVFPPPPDAPRIRYVGSLSTEADLKAGKSALESFGEALFGKSSVRSMLSPYAIYARGNELFVCDGSAQVLHVFDLETRAYRQWRPDVEPNGQTHAAADADAGAASRLRFSQPVALTGDAQGRIYVADSVAGAIFVFDATGHCLGDLGFGTLKRPCGIAYDPLRDRLLVTDSGHHQLLVLSTDGTLVAAIGTRGTAAGEFNFPTNVTIDHTGRVFVSDTLNFRVQVFDTDLKPMGQIGRLGDMPGYFAQPKGVAVDSENHVYVVDSQFEAVQIFTPEGQLLLSFGEEGSGQGEFWLPAGIFIDLNDRIWIADSYNRRVQVFDYLREPLPASAAPSPSPDQPAATTEPRP